MRYLLSSIIILLFVSCASFPKKNGFSETVTTSKTIVNPYFSDPAKDYIYKANITAFGNAFGGIFIVKKLNQNHHRIVFTTEMGNKIFDFTFQGETFKVNSILKDLDKKILINILKNDFKVLVQEKSDVEKMFEKDGEHHLHQTCIDHKKYMYLKDADALTKISRISKGKEKVVFLFSEINDDLVHQIKIAHKNIKLDISLTAI